MSFVRARLKETKQNFADIDDFKSQTDGIKLNHFLDENLNLQKCK